MLVAVRYFYVVVVIFFALFVRTASKWMSVLKICGWFSVMYRLKSSNEHSEEAKCVCEWKTVCGDVAGRE